MPRGFAVTEFADQVLADDIYCMTIDPKGRVFVSGRGYIRILVDDKGDGRADRAIPFADGPKDGAMGLHWEGDALFFTGDGGLRRYRDVDGDGKADGPSELIRALKTGGEHSAHAVRRGPDGWLYVLAGDHAGIDESYATLPTSPIEDPVGGVVLRFSPDLKQSEIVADGLRNAYGMDFNRDGELFTFDSDNERCVSLPWYEPTRFYHIRDGGHYGWLGPRRAEWWRLPPYFFDVVAPVATLGRGSPTGVACYRHLQFPEKYRGGFFLLDWTFGRVYFCKMERAGATYTCKPEIFLEAVGDNGFAPTALAVHPITGDLYVSIGGRGTRGAVYRVRYTQGLRKFDPDEIAALQPKPRMNRPPLDRSILPLHAALQCVEDAKASPNARLDAARSIQLGLGDLVAPAEKGTVWAGYSPRSAATMRQHTNKVGPILAGAFPTGHADVDREVTRLLAMLEVENAAVLNRVTAKLTAESDPVEDFHYLIALARLPGTRSKAITTRTANALLDLDRKIAQRGLNRENHWALRLAELYRELTRKDAGLHAALLARPEFGRPDHASFALAVEFDRPTAAAIFLSRAAKQEDYAWSGAVIEVIGSLPPERSFPLLGRLWGKAGLDEVILPILARTPKNADRDKFLTGLNSPQLATVRLSLRALDKLGGTVEAGPEILPRIRALRRLGDVAEERRLREEIGQQLRKITGQELPAGDKAAWSNWFAKTYPDLSSRLDGADGVDVRGWNRRLAKVDWAKGDAGRGKQIFQKASCAGCHSGTQSLGPDLLGVAGRFSRADLFTAILQPSKDVSPRYRTTILVTEDGKVYQGTIVYEATDSVMLQTGPAATVRVPGNEIAARRFSDVSLMPAGLLEKLTDPEIADLYVYLRSLGGPMSPPPPHGN